MTEPEAPPLPMPIVTPRLLIRPKREGDGAPTFHAIQETWAALHRWMRWAERLDTFSAEACEARTRDMMASFSRREELELLACDRLTGEPLVWTGFHSVDWPARSCEIGYWVRRNAQGRGIATETTLALLHYGFGALGMQRVGLSHAAGNDASRRVAEKAGFQPEGIARRAMLLPGGRLEDRWLYSLLSSDALQALSVRWGDAAERTPTQP